MEIVFILVAPAIPENIGAAARALKTMGWRELRLVTPCDHLQDRARWLAHGSQEILEQALVCDSLPTAARDLDFLIATTARRRHQPYHYHTPEEVIQFLGQRQEQLERVGLVFGREDNGLTNQEIAQCDLVSSIPLPQPYPAVNLAQAVMIYAYVSQCLAQSRQPPKDTGRSNPSLAPSGRSLEQGRGYTILNAKIKHILDWLAVPSTAHLRQRVRQRIALLDHADLHLLHFICNCLLDKITDTSNGKASPGK